jgi:hypothetical protein
MTLAVLAWMSALPLAAQTKLDVRFGILVSSADGDEQFVETTRVPNIAGQSYGWFARVEPGAEPVVWIEELKLPAPPKIWDGPTAVSEDRTTAQTRGVIAAGESEFSSFWSITAGDPSGRYSLVLKISDGVVAEFEFDVVDAR